MDRQEAVNREEAVLRIQENRKIIRLSLPARSLKKAVLVKCLITLCLK